MIFKRAKFILLSVSLLSVTYLGIIGITCRTEKPIENEIEKAARGVITRLLGERANEFILEQIQPDEGRDVFEVIANNGRVYIRGSSPVAISRGFYEYLRRACKAHVSWEGNRLPLPKPLPDFPETRISTPYRFRHYLNVCAFGYTTVWWDWDRWEREIDWMAMHGINMPMALIGQEAIWKRIWNEIGLTDEDLEDYFTGPAFLPWHRMGNVNGHHGPLPQGWLDKRCVLQKRILDRMHELGMKPVVPAFSGYVPKPLKKVHPETEIIDMKPSYSFSDEYTTTVLSPKDPLFAEIGSRFIKAYRQEYGPVQYYLADTFNEMVVPVAEEIRFKELAAFGEAVYKSIVAGDPNGIWVMQGWIFYYGDEFKDKESASALLSKVPDDRMIIIDMGVDYRPDQPQGWQKHDAFYGKQYIYSIIHNFGGRNRVYGNLPFYSSNPIQALHHPDRGKLVGFGISTEGFEHNSVAYELMTDMAWSTREIELELWLRDYCASRYGAYPATLEKAWQLLLQTQYSEKGVGRRHLYQRRPDLKYASPDLVPFPKLIEAVKLFLAAAKEIGNSELYRCDLIDLMRHYLGEVADSLIAKSLDAHKRNDFNIRDQFSLRALQILKDIDTLITARPQHQLSRWINAARSWGSNRRESDYYEEDARMQITIWGGPVLFDYAAKVWSGLIRDFYLPRWRLFFEAVKEGKQVDFVKWDTGWTHKRGVSESSVIKDPVAESHHLLKRWNDWDAER